MIQPNSVTEQMMFVTLRIVGLNKEGKPLQFGTGFLFNFTAGEKTLPVLVTNKHVVEGCAATGVVIHTRSETENVPSGNTSVTLEAQLGNGWIPHPNAATDLCALPIGRVFSSMKPPPFYRGLDEALIPTQQVLDDLDAVEDVLMVGYPNGLWDEKNNFPLIRRGITASHPAVPFELPNYPHTPLTVLDIASFGGSSGSPVFVYSGASYSDKRGNVTIGQRLIFLGVLFAGPVQENDGSIVIREIPTSSVPIPVIRQPINLGYVISSSELLTLKKEVLSQMKLI